MRLVRLLLLTSVAGFGLMGQGAAAQSNPVANGAEDAQSTATTIIVTGSRIANSGMVAPTPLTVLSAETFQQTAPSSVDDVIGLLPAFRSNSGPNQVQRNAGAPATGQSLANLRGLGAQRTLMLVDGRRMAPTNAVGTTDTSIIPVGMIERIEVVTGGASAAYGSDAVAGVVNFVLTDRVEGIRGSIVGGLSQSGDNEEYGANIVFGINGMDDRLHFVFGADYNRNYGVGNIYERDWSAVEPGNSGNPISFGASRPAGTPAFGWANGVEYAAQTPGGVITGATTTTGAASSLLNLLAFNPDGSTSTLVRGPVFGNLMINSSSNPIATPIAQWNLKQPLERFASMARLSFDVSDNLTLFADGNLAFSNVFTLSQYHQAPTITILASNPFIPAAVRTLMTANNIASFNMGRVQTEWLGTSGDQNARHVQASAGARGSVFESFSWDTYFTYGQGRINSQTYGTREANLYAALYAVRDTISGNIVCGPVATNPGFAASRLSNSVQVANVLAGCVPLNPFGAGNVSDAARNYVSGIEYTDINANMKTFAANISGPLFELPGGDFSIAVGGEVRWDSLTQVADTLQEIGLYSSGNARSYSGDKNVKEFYAEVEIPIIDEVGLNGAIRRTDYNISGAVTTWKLGATLEPFEGLRFRVTRSRDIRAPSLSDLFLVGGVSATGSFVNLFNGVSGRLPTQTVGNPNLTPEIADTFTAGVTYVGGGAVQGLRFSADYYKIEVEDVIASVGATDIMTRCFAGQTLYCNAITFDSSTFGINNILVRPFNQSLLEVEGFDVELGYNSSLEGVGLPGRLNTSVFASYLMHYQSTDVAGPAGITREFAGYQNASPKLNVITYLSYNIEPITIGLQARYFSSVRFSDLRVGPGEAGYDPASTISINKNTFESQIHFNLNLAYDFEVRGNEMQLFGNVNNLLNSHPPEFAIAAINLGGNPYDYVGRTFKIGLRFEL